MTIDKSPKPGAWAELLRAWPILSMVLAAFVAGLLKWSDIQRDLGVIERRQTEAERRLALLETADLAVGAVLAETRIALSELRTELRLLREDVRKITLKP
ncbi:MAG: hypothetical protein ACOVVK_24225 [Elsteraceae bacterium]